MSFEAWHGSRYGECFFMRGHEKPVAWFSFNRSEAEAFAKLAWTEDNRLPTKCIEQGSVFAALGALDEFGVEE